MRSIVIFIYSALLAGSHAGVLRDRREPGHMPPSFQQADRKKEMPVGFRWPELHSGYTPLVRQYKEAMPRFVQPKNPVNIVTLTGECEFAIFKPKGDTPATLARNQSRTLGLAEGLEWTTRNGRMNLSEVHMTGDVAGWNGWFHGNYGHTIHDHLPALAWLFQNTDVPLLVLDVSLTKEIVRCVFGPELSKRIVWIQKDVIIRITGSLTVISNPTRSGTYKPARSAAPLRQALQLQLVKSTTCKSNTRREPTVIYYSRNSNKTFHGRSMDKQNEGLVVSEIQAAMKKWNIPGEVVIFNGEGQDGEGLSVGEQIQLFSSARFVIGPHGSGMTNIAWVDWSGKSDVQVLEFICTPESTAVQHGCPWGKTYYNLLAAPEHISYHHIGFTNQSTAETTYVNIDDLRQALDVMMSPYPKALRYMQPLDIVDPDTIKFFWHVPKAAGSYAKQIFNGGYGLQPRAALGVPFQFDMFLQRMLKQPPTMDDQKFATKQCELRRETTSKKYKWDSLRWDSCIQTISLSTKNHLCLPGCLNYLSTPLLYDAEAIMGRTPRKARVATILREPVSRFMSQFHYLQIAKWEPTYHPTNETVDQYVQKGDYERNWMVRTLSNCTTGIITDVELEVAKQVLSRMLVGFTDNLADFFDRLEVYWKIPQRSIERARKSGIMKRKVNVNIKPNAIALDQPSDATLAILQHELRHDIALFNYAKDVLWDSQAAFVYL